MIQQKGNIVLAIHIPLPHLCVLQQRVHKRLKNPREKWRRLLQPALIEPGLCLAVVLRQYAPSCNARVQCLSALAAVVKDATLLREGGGG